MKASVSSVPRDCATCGNSFQPTSNRQKYCTSCGRRNSATCEVCGKLFKQHPTASGRWCSRECWGLSRRSEDTLPKRCGLCDETFKPRRPDQRYCSQACFGASTRRPDLECRVCGQMYNSRHYSGTCGRECAGVLRRRYAEGLNCETCGKHITWTFSRTRRFCSHECRRTPVGSRMSSGSGGYIKIRTEDGWKLEHRYAMERLLGRPLLPSENVHHINGERTDNSVDGPLVEFRSGNLELWTTSQPKGQRVEEKVEWAVELLRQYQPDLLAP